LPLLLKNLLFTVVVPGTVAVYVPLLLTRGQRVGPVSASIAATVLLATGAMIYAWCVWDFARFGRGTPAPLDAPKRLVARGLYRHTRNPMYLGVLCTILGWAVLFRAGRLLLYALGIGLCFHLFVVLYEEPHLRKVFEASYEEYRSRVNRWLPGIPRRADRQRSETTP
jgi:protein-S-isoprenylcysteine O-methyltransferase Ste14